uniref:Uncharacterized protein n=1 Tax=Chromera velia CCMP2878 TaxID=1169474 RepID=A0A0G4HLT3_9ALVE|eukprot:Cvel_28861.t1-p1 / transcript=Cvel_28861.t1 / gene=Cvel_28861 / organism=Chromera_velia_CCMP2878 / gene_product=hypothetical protein / transcript_product=hypothetical protein / location=Cvel_scaffold3853:11976-12983(+) / protein_length=174 / sequence_SO=supercontig / SO=protein_coding / is_pseudo=false
MTVQEPGREAGTGPEGRVWARTRTLKSVPLSSGRYFDVTVTTFVPACSNGSPARQGSTDVLVTPQETRRAEPSRALLLRFLVHRGDIGLQMSWHYVGDHASSYEHSSTGGRCRRMMLPLSDGLEGSNNTEALSLAARPSTQVSRLGLGRPNGVMERCRLLFFLLSQRQTRNCAA